MTIFLWIRDTCLRPCHQTIITWYDTLWRREEDTQDMKSSPPGPLPFLANCSPYLEDNTPHFWHSGRGRVIFVSDPDPHLISNMLNGVYVCMITRPLNYLHIQLCQRSSRVTCYVGCGIVLAIHNVSSKNTRRPRKHTIMETPLVALAVEGSTQHHQCTSPTRWMGPIEGSRLPHFSAYFNIYGALGHSIRMWVVEINTT